MGSTGRNERDRRRKEKKERRGEWESSDGGSEEERCESLEARIRGLMERVEGLERGIGKVGEKKGNAGSSSDGEEGKGNRKWDGENSVLQGGTSGGGQFLVEAANLEAGEGDIGTGDEEVEMWAVSTGIENRVAGGEGAKQVAGEW